MSPASCRAPSRNSAGSSGTAPSCFSPSPKPPSRKSPSSPARPMAARTASWPRSIFEPMPISPGPPRRSPSWARKVRWTLSTNANWQRLPIPSAKSFARKKFPNSANALPIHSSRPSAATSMRLSIPPTRALASSPPFAPSKTNATPTPRKNTATFRCSSLSWVQVQRAALSGRGVVRTALDLLQQVLLQELHCRVKLKILVRLFPVSMTLVLGDEQPDGRTLFLQRVGDLLGFADWHARVVLSRDHQHGLLDFFDVVHWRDFLQELSHLRFAFVAVLHASQVAPIGFRVLEKGHQVRHAYDVHGAANPVAVKCRDGQRHVSAVASASHRNPLAV